MSYTEQMTQKLSYCDVINSQSVNNTSVSSIGVDMSKFKRVLFIITPTNVGAAGTVDGRLQSAAATSFASPHNIANSNFTQLTANNVATTVEVRADQVVGNTAGDRYVRLNLTGGGNAVTVGAIGLGSDSEQKPASQYNLNTTYLTVGTVTSGPS
jgi:hypothetical protein